MYRFLKAILLWIVFMEIGYGKIIDNFEDNKNKIFGGMNAIQGEFPWQVAIYMKNITMQKYLLGCGGAIMNRQWVITAAHCLEGLKATSIMIQIGKTNLNEKEPHEKIFEISKYICHEGFTDFLIMFNDIALIKLKEPLEYTRDVRPIRISKPGISYENMTCVTSGWGYLSLNDKRPNGTIRNPNLQRVSLQNWPDAKCARHPQFICSGGLPEGGKSACQGDSGGPIQCFIDEEYVLIGIVSHGRSCGLPNEPDLSTSISYYHNWIFDTISKYV